MTAAMVLTGGSLSVEVLPERGLDVGVVEWGGVSVQWSRVLGTTPGSDWFSAWPGGLVTTCGLNNVGKPSEGHGPHGKFAQTAAEDVAVQNSSDGSTVVRGTVVDAALSCRREVAVDAAGRLRIEDVVTNTSGDSLQSPMLYHVNFGAPFFDGDLEIIAQVERTVPRDDASSTKIGNWHRPASVQRDHEVVLEHFLTSGAARSVTLLNPTMGISIDVRWHGLERLHHWIDLTDGRLVTAIEPANCSVLGREADRLVGTAPFIPSGASRTTGLMIEVVPL